jgi:hypothetical protein
VRPGDFPHATGETSDTKEKNTKTGTKKIRDIEETVKGLGNKRRRIPSRKEVAHLAH